MTQNYQIHHRVLLVIQQLTVSCLEKPFSPQNYATNCLAFLNNHCSNVVMIFRGYKCKASLFHLPPILNFCISFFPVLFCMYSLRCYASVCSLITPTTVFTVMWAPACRRLILEPAPWYYPMPMYHVCWSSHGCIHLFYTGVRS